MYVIDIYQNIQFISDDLDAVNDVDQKIPWLKYIICNHNVLIMSRWALEIKRQWDRDTHLYT